MDRGVEPSTRMVGGGRADEGRERRTVGGRERGEGRGGKDGGRGEEGKGGDEVRRKEMGDRRRREE